MTTTELPAGYEAHVEGMSEEANEARIRRNEVTNLRNQLDNKLQTLEALQDEMTRTEAAIRVLTDEIEYLTEEEAA